MRGRGIVVRVILWSFVAFGPSRSAWCGDDLAGYSIQNLEGMAIDARNKGNFSAAIAFVDEILRRDPNNLGAHSTRGKLLFDVKDREGALKEFEFVLEELSNGKQSPGVERAHLLHRKGYTLYDLHRYNEAAVAVDAALVLDPTYLNAWNTRGNISKELGQPTEALKFYKEAVRLSPEYLVAQTNVINLAVQVKAYDDATLYCSHMRSRGARAEAAVVTGGLDADTFAGKTPVNPTPVLLYWNCSVAFREVGTHPKEYEEFLGLAASAPVYDADDLFYRAQAKRALSQIDGALADYTECLSRDSRHLEAYKSKGRVLYDQKRYEEAYRLYGEFADAFPHEALAYQGRASVLLAMDKFKEALPDAQRGVELGPNEAYTWDTLGWIHRKMGDLDAAQGAFEKVLEFEPNNSHARTFLAFRLQEKGEFDRMIVVLKPLVDSGGADAVELSRYGEGLFRVGRYDEALSALSASIAKDPSNSITYVRRATVHFVLRHYKEARIDGDKVVDLHPNDRLVLKWAEIHKGLVDACAAGKGTCILDVPGGAR